ncbi:MAG TPA: alcohol dehydrogenase catalytic domain-containing protein [Steroidobacteraceae bacterium]
MTEGMRHLVIETPGRVAWRETRRPTLQSGLDAIVRPIVVGRCDLDVGFVRGLVPIASGEPIGHECIAEVVEIGESVATVCPGMRVVVAAQISCGICRACRLGLTGRCESVPFGASFGMGRPGNFGGALADYVRVPFADSMLVPVPEGLDPIGLIGAADMALDAWRAVGAPLLQRPGSEVLVLGGKAKVIALYAVALGLALGAGRVVFVATEPEERARAAALGARVTEALAPEHGRFDIIVDACGEPAVLPALIRAAAPEAIVTTVVFYEDEIRLPQRELYFRGITLRMGRPNLRPAMDHVLSLCRSGVFHPGDVEPSVFAFDDAVDAWLSEDLRTVVSRA